MRNSRVSTMHIDHRVRPNVDSSPQVLYITRHLHFLQHSCLPYHFHCRVLIIWPSMLYDHSFIA
jgi:hypothetical protein